MISSISNYRCRCGVRAQVFTETDKARITTDVLIEVACPRCAEKQAIYAHRIVKISIELPVKAHAQLCP